eukprot:TRINITY_DN1556_c0_g1_i3.p1 TRINITY_DN1556_c0_g1~~TRINITY_DN1556_c0_g1_i3.p1  ORF type:complete len:441 (-),score=128.16 TRINITY_DN1556_c0_g1_i3:866-2188(-)
MRSKVGDSFRKSEIALNWIVSGLDLPEEKESAAVLAATQVEKLSKDGEEGVELLIDRQILTPKRLMLCPTPLFPHLLHSFFNISSTTLGRVWLESIDFERELLETNEINGIALVRLVDLFCGVSNKLSIDFHIDFVIRSMARVAERDELMFLSILEILGSFVRGSFGNSVLRTKHDVGGIVPTVFSALKQVRKSSSYSDLEAPTMEFLSKVIQFDAHREEYEEFVEIIWRKIQHPDRTPDFVLANSMICVQSLASRNLFELLELKPALVMITAKQLASSTREMRILSAHITASILQSIRNQKVRDGDEKKKELAEKLYGFLPHNPTPVAFVMNQLKLPFTDVRTAMLHLFKSFSEFEFGVFAMFRYPGFFDFIINRDTETEKQLLEWKHEIVKKSVDEYESSMREIVGDVRYYTLINFIRDGPFAGPADPEALVATERQG